MNTATEKRITISDLQSIGARMRERQEEIEAARNQVLSVMATLIHLGSQQGKDCLIAKAKLGKVVAWSDWLNAQIPNLSPSDAAKYERITREQLEDARQCFFAFFDTTPRRATCDATERPKPAVWEAAWGWAIRLRKIISREDITKWNQAAVAATRQEVEPVAKALWPDKF